MNIIWTDWSRDTTTLIRWLKNWKNETSFLKQEALKENNMEEELNILKEMIAKHDPKAESYLKELAEKYNSPENKKLFRQFARELMDDAPSDMSHLCPLFCLYSWSLLHR